MMRYLRTAKSFRLITILTKHGTYIAIDSESNIKANIYDRQRRDLNIVTEGKAD